jgi:hypothetical protein
MGFFLFLSTDDPIYACARACVMCWCSSFTPAPLADVPVFIKLPDGNARRSKINPLFILLPFTPIIIPRFRIAPRLSSRLSSQVRAGFLRTVLTNIERSYPEPTGDAAHLMVHILRNPGPVAASAMISYSPLTTQSIPCSYFPFSLLLQPAHNPTL